MIKFAALDRDSVIQDVEVFLQIHAAVYYCTAVVLKDLHWLGGCISGLLQASSTVREMPYH